MTRVHGKPNKERKIKHMKNRNNVFTATLVVLAFAIAPVVKAAQHLDGGPIRLATNASPTSPRDEQMPVITVHSTDNVTRGKTGSFVLVRGLGKVAEDDVRPALMLAGTYVNFKISGTAIAGVDYVLLVSPAYIGGSGYGLIQVKTLPDVRGSAFGQALSVIVTLEPGAGYAIGAASSATMWIKPAVQSSNPASN
jgi:hypothetical protein